jgi:hypothetical protein
MSTVSTKLDRIENSVNNIRSTINMEGAVIEDVASGVSNTINNLNTEITTLNNENTALTETIEQKDGEIVELEEEIERLKEAGAVDLENYYTKAETEALVDEKIEEIEIPTTDLSNYYNKEETEAKIDEKLQEFEAPTTDLSDYYNKSQTDAKIDEKINAIPVSDLLHDVGHFNTADDLPSTGQQSETALAKTFTYLATPYLAFNYSQKPSNNKDTNEPSWFQSFLTYLQGVKSTYGDKFLVFTGKGNDWYAVQGFITNYPDMIGFSPEVYENTMYGNNLYLYAKAKYDATKPVYLVRRTKSTNTFTVTQITADTTILGNCKETSKGFYSIMSDTSTCWASMWLNTPIKYFPYTEHSMLINNNGQNFCYSGNTYCMKPNDNYEPVLLMSESQAKVNDIATVGENNELYKCYAGPKWKKVGGGTDTYSKEEIDNMIGDINTALTEIVEGGE